MRVRALSPTLRAKAQRLAVDGDDIPVPEECCDISKHLAERGVE